MRERRWKAAKAKAGEKAKVDGKGVLWNTVSRWSKPAVEDELNAEREEHKP